MADKPEDLNLPAAVVSRLIKETLPSGIKLSKDAQTAINKAAGVFVLYCTACANSLALRNKRKTLTANDVFSALEDMEFDNFVPELKICLEAFREEQKAKVAERKRKQTSNEEVMKAKKASMVESSGEGGEVEEREERQAHREEGHTDTASMST